MEYAVILHNYEKNTRTIPNFVSSFDNFIELMKINYQKIRHINDISCDNLRKGTEYPSNEKYIIYNSTEFNAILYYKKQKKYNYCLDIICKWELAKFDIKNNNFHDESLYKNKNQSQNQSQSQNQNNHNQITNFKLTGLTQGVMFIIYKNDSFFDNFNNFINKVDDRISDFTKRKFNKIIISNNNKLKNEGNDNLYYWYDWYEEYTQNVINENINNIIIIDTNCVKQYDIAHFIDIINNFEPNKMCLIVLIQEESSFIEYIQYFEHIMLTKNVSDSILKLVFKLQKLRDLDIFPKFSLCVKQVINQVGQIVITRGNKDMTWI
jgi:hypothetical protein